MKAPSSNLVLGVSVAIVVAAWIATWVNDSMLNNTPPNGFMTKETQKLVSALALIPTAVVIFILGVRSVHYLSDWAIK